MGWTKGRGHLAMASSPDSMRKRKCALVAVSGLARQWSWDTGLRLGGIVPCSWAVWMCRGGLQSCTRTIHIGIYILIIYMVKYIHLYTHIL